MQGDIFIVLRSYSPPTAFMHMIMFVVSASN